MEVGLILIFLAGVAEFFKDLSEEGKLKGYWDKNHKPMFHVGHKWREAVFDDGLLDWWRFHWLQGGVWDYIPVWIRQYLAFRDGWHLLKFLSLNLFAVGICITFGLPWYWCFIMRVLFSTPETIGRIIYNKTIRTK
jgi:hypothetical protein